MKNGDTVIFLDYFENVEKLAPLIRRLCARLNTKPVVVSSNFDVTPLSKDLDLKVISFDELLSKEDYVLMDKWTFDTTPTWYLKLRASEGVTEYKGLKFGAILEEKAQRFFSYTIKNLAVALKIKEHLHPERIILIGERAIFGRLPSFIKEELGIPVLFVPLEEREGILKEAIKGLRIRLIEGIENIFDAFTRMAVALTASPGAILIDRRLYMELKDLKTEFRAYLYIFGKGLRVRLGVVKEGKLLMLIPAGNFFRGLDLFGRFYRYWRSVRKDADFIKVFTYRDFKIWKVVETFIEEFIIHDFPLVYKRIKYLGSLYKILRPAAIVMREAMREEEKAIALTAKEARIPTLVLQHGMLFGDRVSPYLKVHSEKIALWGRAAADWYAASGNDAGKFVITGRPQHDFIYHRKYPDKEKIESLLGKNGAGGGDGDIILCIMNMFKNVKYRLNVYFPNDSEYVAMMAISDAASRFPDKRFVIKLHPFDAVVPKRLFSSFRINVPPNVTFVKDIDTLSLIENSSLVIVSLFSSASLDAVILNKPLITLNFYKIDDIAPLSQSGVALGVRRPEELPEAIGRIFQDKELRDHFSSNRKDFIDYYASRIDGKATERIINLMKELCNEITVN